MQTLMGLSCFACTDKVKFLMSGATFEFNDDVQKHGIWLNMCPGIYLICTCWKLGGSAIQKGFPPSPTVWFWLLTLCNLSYTS